MTDIFVAPKKKGETEINTPEDKILEIIDRPIEEKPIVTQNKIKDNNESYSFKKKMGLLSAYGVKPYGVSFGEQAEDEEIFLFLRRHLVTNIPWIFAGFILILIPPFLFLVLNYYSFLITIPTNFLFILILFYYLAVVTFLFTEYINWFFNISLITDKRVVDLNYSDIIYHDMAVTKLDLIEDIDYVQAGFIRSFFDFGNIYIQTAGAKQIFHFIAVPKPARATEIIQNLMGGDKNVWD
jgi:hypothetical protein